MSIITNPATGGGGSGITQLTGDITAGPGSGSQAATLASVIIAGGPIGSAVSVPILTWDAKGRLTAVTSTTITPAASNITGGAALTKVDDTNITLTLGGTPASALLAASSITAGWAGTLAVARGGTGSGTAFTLGSVIFAGASGVYTQNNSKFFWDNTNFVLDITGSISIVSTANITPFAISGYSLTGSDIHSMLNLGGTWNTSGYVDAAILLNITNTASATSSSLLGPSFDPLDSLLLDLQTNGISCFSADAGGHNWTQLSSNTVSTNYNLGNTSSGGHTFQFFSTGAANNPGHFGVYDGTARSGSGYTLLDLNGNNAVVSVPGVSILGWAVSSFYAGSPSGIDTGLAKNAAGLVEINNGVAGTFRDLVLRDIYTNDASFALRSKTTITGPATGSVPTLTAGPKAGNPTKWLPYDDNGTTRYIPSW